MNQQLPPHDSRESGLEEVLAHPVQTVRRQLMSGSNALPLLWLSFAILQRGVYMMPLLGYPDATHDPLKLSYIGARSPETSITV